MDTDQYTQTCTEIDLNYCQGLCKSLLTSYKAREMCDVVLIASLNDQK